MLILNIVIPMAGAGSRFAQSGYIDPKPLVSIHGIPMIRWVIKNLSPNIPHRFIFICQESHIEKYGLKSKLQSWAPGCVVMGVNGLTEGAACTVLHARTLIDSDNPLMIANSDQYIDFSIDRYLERLHTRNLDGLIMTMTSNDPKWSFVGCDSQGLVNTVVEKEVISNEATVGIYNFRKGSDFVLAADQMISKKLKVKNEYYVAPTYNQLIAHNAKIGIYNIGGESSGMYGLGTPADLQLFLNNELSQKVALTLWK